MTDVEKTNDDPNKKQTRSQETPVESSTGGTLAKSHGESFTSFSHNTLAVSEFSIEDTARGVSVTAQGVKPAKDSSKPNETSTPDSLDRFSAKANEIMEVAGTLKVPTADQIAIGGRVYDRSDVIAQGPTPNRVDDRGVQIQPRQLTEVQKAAEATRLAAQDMAHLKALNEQIRKKGDMVQYLGNVSDGFKQKMDEWWKTVPDSYKNLMKEKGIHVVVAEYTTQVYPNANNILARGHHGDSIATTGGAFVPEIHSVLMVDKPVQSSVMQKSDQIRQNQGAMKLGLTQSEVSRKAWHELGHALDYDAFSHISRSPEYKKAFDAGIMRMNAKLIKDLPENKGSTDSSPNPDYQVRDAKNFDYYLSREAHPARGHEEDKPHEEMLAELFSRAHYQKDLRPSDIRMLVVFKEVVDLLRAKHIMPLESEPTTPVKDSNQF